VGFVGRDGTLAELATAVERALAGEVRCSPKLAALLCERVAALAGRMGDVPSGLTRRERQIADLVADGLSNKEIAIELRIGPATVKNHIHNILEKLHVPRRGAIGSRLRGVMA
jgi:two-component system, NarL family, nitrate/nitrite response regulator NarL